MWGRDAELDELKKLEKQKKSKLIVIMGRRRIGKSTLAQIFGKKNYGQYLEFSGLSPTPKQSNKDQLNHFIQQLKERTSYKGTAITDWYEAFSLLAKISARKKTFILLDEISWMGAHDHNFPGKLKSAWDIHLKHNPNLMLVLCGSVSAWIETNILKNSDFVGRISREIILKELPLKACNKFWDPRSQTSSFDKIKMLSITGAVPKYLEEMDSKAVVEKEIKRLCFSEGGFLVNEYEKIFNDIFQSRATAFKKIVSLLVEKKLSASEISKKLGKELDKETSTALHILEISGFIKRDYNFQAGKIQERTSRYRISDNYLRFALKYILPNKEKISIMGRMYKEVDFLKNWPTISGFQFENLVLNHIDEILQHLNINPNEILSASPHIQRKKTRNKGVCQIDLLIESKLDTLYICEFKFRHEIDASVVKEVERKVKVLERKKHQSVRTILIYEGDIRKNDKVIIEDYFYDVLKLGTILEG